MEQITADIQSLMYTIQPNYGRIYNGAFAGQPWHYLMDSCLFVDNFQPVIIPEVDTQFGSDMMVGNTVFIGLMSSHGIGGTTCTISNIRMQNCDDGGIFIGHPAETLRVRNIEIIDTRRMGMIVRNSSRPLLDTVIENVYIDNLQVQQAYMHAPYYWTRQSALEVSGNQDGGILVSNVSIVNSSAVVLCAAHNSQTQHRIQNSLFHNNTYDVFNRSGNLPWTSFYCLFEEGFPGEGNLWNVDPVFDPELGLPWLFSASPLVGVRRNNRGGGSRPATALLPAYPNPFNPVTQILFHLDHNGPVQIRVYNLRGQRVQTLLDQPLAAGEHRIPFDAADLSSGVYIIQLKTRTELEHQKILLIK